MPPTSRLLQAARAVAAGLASALLFAASVTAQTTKAEPAASGPPISLPAYVPTTDLLLYFECTGLDANVSSWQKTATYKILNDTPTGAMLEEVATQFLDQTVLRSGVLKVTGGEIVSLAKHMAKHGFVLGGTGRAGGAEPATMVFVARGVFKNKAQRPIVGRLLGSMTDPKVKPKLVDVAGHKIVVQKNRASGFLGWWVEDSRKEDLIVLLGSKDEKEVTASAKVILETLEGVRPNAEVNPGRVALSKEADGFQPVSFGFVNLAALPTNTLPPALGLAGLKIADIRMGFQDKESVTITRFFAPKPRQGLLALFDQPTFEKSELPMIPEGVDGFTVFSVDAKNVVEQLISIAKAVSPPTGEQIDIALEQVKAKTKLRLKEDILGHLSPKMAVYVAPGSADAAKSQGGPLAMLTGGQSIPRVTLIGEVDDPVVFGRTLDQLMITVNQALRTAIPPMPAPGGQGGGEGAQAKAKSADSGLSFRLIPGATKVYILGVPPQLSSLIPSYVRPTIRLDGKRLAISISSESARQALEVKQSVATTTFAGTLKSAPEHLIFTNVTDHSGSLPAALASFPGTLQVAYNGALATATPPPPGGDGAPTGGGFPGGSAKGPGGFGVAPGGGPGAIAPGGAGGPPAGFPGAPGGPQPGGSGGAAPAVTEGAVAAGLSFNIDASKLPSAAAIKPLLFPSSIFVSIEEEGIKITSREAFPNLAGSSSSSAISGQLAKLLGLQTPSTGATAPTQVPPQPEAVPGAFPGRPAGGPAGRRDR